jgi:hypothetical protein
MQFIPGTFGNSPEEQKRLVDELRLIQEQTEKNMAKTAKFLIASNIFQEKLRKQKRTPLGLSED